MSVQESIQTPLEVRTVVITPFQQNCRFLIDTKFRRGVVIDPGGEVPRLIQEVRELKVELSAILLTHSHIDHAGGVAEFLRQYQMEFGVRLNLFGHADDGVLRLAIAQQAAFFGLSPGEFQDCPEPDHLIGEGDTVKVGDIPFEVRFVPGHAPGHVVFFSQAREVKEKGSSGSYPLLIGGDTLFRGSIGRTDFPGCDHETLLRSIRQRIFTLPDETVVMPGHGPNTTVGFERKTNPFLKG